jgi:hypothetical protein
MTSRLEDSKVNYLVLFLRLTLAELPIYNTIYKTNVG